MKTINLSNFGLQGVAPLSRDEMKGIKGGAFYRCICGGAAEQADTFLISYEGEGPEEACDNGHGMGPGYCTADPV